MRCISCNWENGGVLLGTVRGLCSVCTVETRKLASSRGVDISTKMPGPVHRRECKVGGVRLFWWGDCWRAERKVAV